MDLNLGWTRCWKWKIGQISRIFKRRCVFILRYSLTTNVHNLTIVPAGKTHHLSLKLLASNAMQELAHEMSTRYSDRIIIIFDCPRC